MAKYIGLSHEESEFANMANIRMNNINFLADVELEDLDHAKLQLIRDIIEDNWVCKDCEKVDEQHGDFKDDLFNSFEEIRYKLNQLSEYIDNNSKSAVDKWNDTIKILMQEVEKIEKSIDKNIKEEDTIGKFNMDFVLDQLTYHPKED